MSNGIAVWALIYSPLSQSSGFLTCVALSQGGLHLALDRKCQKKRPDYFLARFDDIEAFLFEADTGFAFEGILAEQRNTVMPKQ